MILFVHLFEKIVLFVPELKCEVCMIIGEVLNACAFSSLYLKLLIKIHTRSS
jgi:hypothetical protein